MSVFDLPALWGDIVSFFTVSPFWFYLFWGVVLILGALLLGWLFPVLRSLTSAVVLAIIGMLVAYRRGETDAQQRAREQQARERRRPPPASRWPWESSDR
jgi:membrane protein implicated in regulation of membrane protease activity